MGLCGIHNRRLIGGENFMTINLTLEQAIRNLTCGDLQILLLMILRKLVTNNWVHVSSDLVSEDGGRVGVIEIAFAFLGGFLIGDSNAEI